MAEKALRFFRPFPVLGIRSFFVVISMRHLSEIEKKIYSRNILLPEVGEEGQVKLLESRVLIIGLGGLGSPALFYLAAAGVGEIGHRGR